MRILVAGTVLASTPGVRCAVLLAFLFVSACSWEISLGPGDGVSQVRFEADVANPALKSDGTIVLFRDAVLLTAKDSQRYLAKFGPDKIGAIRGVTLELVELRIDGVDLARNAAPTVTLGGHEVAAVPGAEIELDDDQVDDLRAAILGGTELRAPLVIRLEAPLETLDATRPELHILLVVQPTLRVDVTRAI